LNVLADDLDDVSRCANVFHLAHGLSENVSARSGGIEWRAPRRVYQFYPNTGRK
jgi:hypothetical protein